MLTFSFFEAVPSLVPKHKKKSTPFLPPVSFTLVNVMKQHEGRILFEYDCYCLVAKLCLTLCNPLDWGTPGFPILHCLPGFAQTHVHWVGDAIQPSYSLSSSSPPAFNLSQHQGLFQWVSSSHQVAKVLEFQLQYRSFQWIFIFEMKMGKLGHCSSV